MSNPVPVRLREKFFSRMDATNNDDLPDGAWWCVLEETAQQFLTQHHLTKPWHDPFEAVHQYLRHKGDGSK